MGGTTLNLDASGNILSESAWSGSGGGISAYEPQPSYQSGVVTQSQTARTNPDVAYDADPNTGFPIYNSYTNPASTPWAQFGGTSDAAPQWAALIAIADQGRALAGLGSLDGRTQTLPVLYTLALQRLPRHHHGGEYRHARLFGGRRLRPRDRSRHTRGQQDRAPI